MRIGTPGSPSFATIPTNSGATIPISHLLPMKSSKRGKSHLHLSFNTIAGLEASRHFPLTPAE